MCGCVRACVCVQFRTIFVSAPHDTAYERAMIHFWYREGKRETDRHTYILSLMLTSECTSMDVYETVYVYVHLCTHILHIYALIMYTRVFCEIFRII